MIHVQLQRQSTNQGMNRVAAMMDAITFTNFSKILAFTFESYLSGAGVSDEGIPVS